MSQALIERMSPEARDLCLQIHQAFASAPYPGDDQIVYDNSGVHLECAAIKAKLVGRHWKDLPFETLRELKSALSFLSPVGYRFYLPAFLLLCVVDFYGADVLVEAAVYGLTLPDEADVERIRVAVSTNPGALPLPADEWTGVLLGLVAMHRSGDASRRFFERVSGFTPAQGRAIYRWLVHLRDTYAEEFLDGAPEVAIERYWGELYAK